MKKIVILLVFISNFSNAQVTLTHNVGDDIIETSMFGCSMCCIHWSRDFVLEDFGISTNETLTIEQGIVGFSYVGWGVDIQFNIYEIDADFPATFSTDNLIGSSQVVHLPYNSNLNITSIIFDTPVVVPPNIQRILVEVKQVYTGASSPVAFFAGTVDDTDFSWYRGNSGCLPTYYINTVDLGRPDARYYIKISGETLSDDDVETTKFSVSPNPTNGIVSFNTHLSSSIEKATLYDINGRNIVVKISDNTIDLRNLPSGVYLLHILYNNSIAIKKIIKT